MSPRIAIAPPGQRSFLAEAVEAGGGTVVELEDAEALIWTDTTDTPGLRAAIDRRPELRWVQVPFAGIEPLVGAMDRGRIWTCGKGVYAEEVAEHALAMLLAGFRHLAGYARRTAWSAQVGRNLLGARVTVLGAGGITESLARLLAPFEVELTIVRRRRVPFPGATETVVLDELDGVLPRSDALVLALALTDETRGVIDGRRLQLLPDHAWIINVARGAHIVTDDLVVALESGSIGGAALDVTDPEPLPEGHRLWGQPNCLITPHTANTAEMAVPVLAERVRENVRRFADGEPLVGVVDLDAGY